MIIEEKVRDHINSNSQVKAYTERQPELSGKFIIIEKTNGGKRDRLRSSTIVLQSYAPSLAEAVELNEQMIPIMEALALDESIGSVSLNSDYPFPDTRTKEYRYQAVYNITYL